MTPARTSRSSFAVRLSGLLATGTLALLLACTGSSSSNPTPLTPAQPHLAAGPNHALFVKTDGTVWAWGANDSGQLGDGTVVDRSTPVQVPGLPAIQAVACGGSNGSGSGGTDLRRGPFCAGFSLALAGDGSVWGWGEDGVGQAGSPSSNPMTTLPTPTRIPNLGQVVSIGAGCAFGVAVKADGTVWTWGLGQDGASTYAAPVQVFGLSNIVAVAGGLGEPFLVALDSGGGVWTLGDDSAGQRGDGTRTTVTNLTPYPVQGLPAVRAIAAGTSHCVALGDDGKVYWWGDYYGSSIPGDGTGTPQVLFSQSVQAEAVSGTCVVAGGEVWQLSWALPPAGTGVTSGATAVVQGFDGGLGFQAALMQDGSVHAWGMDDRGQLGTGLPVLQSAPQALAVPGVQQLAAGGKHSLALVTGGLVWGWGENASNQLGDAAVHSSPGAVPGLTDFTALSAGTYASLGIKGDGSVWDWGNGGLPADLALQTRANAIAAGTGDGFALIQGNLVMGWGSNTVGEMGDGSESNLEVTPAIVPSLTGITAMAVPLGAYDQLPDSNYVLALGSGGALFAWGVDGAGVFGNGNTSLATSPVSAAGGATFTQVAAALTHVLALKADGTVWAWGDNSHGQLGQGTFYLGEAVDPNPPVQVPGLAGILAVAAGQGFSVALKGDGTLWVWGENDYGQLGDGTLADNATPAQVVGLTGVTAISAGWAHLLALDAGGLKAWGSDYYGQLGLGRTTYRVTPVAVTF